MASATQASICAVRWLLSSRHPRGVSGQSFCAPKDDKDFDFDCELEEDPGGLWGYAVTVGDMAAGRHDCLSPTAPGRMRSRTPTASCRRPPKRLAEYKRHADAVRRLEGCV